MLLIKTNLHNQPIFLDGAEDVAAELLSNDDSLDMLIDLNDMEDEHIKALFCDLSRQYELQMKDEINKMTEIVDPENSNKTPAEATKMKNEMLKQYNVTDYFKDIQYDVMTVIRKK